MNVQIANPPGQNIFQKFYGSRTFDIIFGIVPAILMSLFCLFVIMATSGRLGWIAVGWIPVKYLFVLSLLGLGSCIYLAIAIFRSPLIKDSARKFYIMMIGLGIFISMVIVFLVCVTIVKARWNGLDLSWLLVGVTFLSLAAIKQIGLLKTSEIRRQS